MMPIHNKFIKAFNSSSKPNIYTHYGMKKYEKSTKYKSFQINNNNISLKIGAGEHRELELSCLSYIPLKTCHNIIFTQQKH